MATVVVDSALAVHRVLGPGLLESTYTAALAIELTERQVPFVLEQPIEGRYRGRTLGVAYRADVVVDGRLLLEIKAVSALEPVHAAQLLSYLRLAGMKLGLLLNFNVPRMKAGIRRIVNGL